MPSIEQIVLAVLARERIKIAAQAVELLKNSGSFENLVDDSGNPITTDTNDVIVCWVAV